MDTRGLCEGTILYLPVEVAGGLLSVGDAHAAQGDGETCGTAIESPMNISLKIEIEKEMHLRFPRFTTAGPVCRHIDSKGYEVTTGIGPDLMQNAKEAVKVVENLFFNIEKGKILGLVGESGCGKSVTAMSIMRLLASPPSFVKKGKILFEDRDLLSFSNMAMRKIRGNSIGMTFQEPMTSLNPCFSIGYQIGEVLSLIRGFMDKKGKKDA